MSDENGHEDEGFVIKVRGLPWSTTVDEILKFFSECTITHGKAGIHMTMSREGRPSGEAYIEMESEEDVEKACKRDRDHMGHRYIEVFRAKRGEMEWVVKRSGINLENAMDDGCVRLRGLPFGCSKEEIAQFFSGLEILPNGISLPTDYTGRSTGEAYVQFVSKDVAERALQKHKEKIGHRYIEIFRSSLSEVRAGCLGPKLGVGRMTGGYNPRPAPYDRGSRFGGANRFNNGRGHRGGNRGHDYDGGWNIGTNYGGRNNNMSGMRGANLDMKGSNYRSSDDWGLAGSGMNLPCIHMRGLPFRATEQDIVDFFRPILPINIHIIYESGGRASGEADVEFGSHEEAVQAMQKDKSHMSHRYIELFLNSPGISGNGRDMAMRGVMGGDRMASSMAPARGMASDMDNPMEGRMLGNRMVNDIGNRGLGADMGNRGMNNDMGGRSGSSVQGIVGNMAGSGGMVASNVGGGINSRTMGNDMDSGMNRNSGIGLGMGNYGAGMGTNNFRPAGGNNANGPSGYGPVNRTYGNSGVMGGGSGYNSFYGMKNQMKID